MSVGEITDRRSTGAGIRDGRYVLISADGHAGPEITAFDDYLEEKYLPDYQAYTEQQIERNAALIAEASAITKTVKRGGDAGNIAQDRSVDWDPELRVSKLDADGVVAEVLFPQSNIPFNPQLAIGAAPEQDPPGVELEVAGARAYNRWLEEFCGSHPERFTGVGVLPLRDPEAAVKEVERVRAAGFRSIYLQAAFPAGIGAYAPYNDPMYEPVWAACAANGVALNVHGGGRLPEHAGPGAAGIVLAESTWFGHRILWTLIFAGVFDRYPELKLIFTESMATWIPGTLRDLDSIMHGPTAAALGDLELTPSEYWHRNCYVGATFLSRTEAEMRDEIGVDRMMWGSDFPHPGTTWPNSTKALRYACAGLPTEDVAKIVSENAADLFGFDLDKLAPLAEKICPTVEQIAEPLPESEVPTDMSEGTTYRKGLWS